MKQLLALIMILSAFSVSADVAGQVMIDQPYVRAAIKQQRNSAAYMHITNQGDNAYLLYAKSPVADSVELHTHIDDNGVMRMRKIEKIDLPTQQAVTMEPGGLHVMLLGLNRDLKTGDEISLTLGFSDGSEKNLKVPVQMRYRAKKKAKQESKTLQDKPKMITH